ncbi:hypothetical protein RD792_001293 [Penstemon davidsonii]|uniref:RING-type E3 ubiquitin transferase n=1 Tax=Penstemon davidsonii TaxID=160366 RepID=A0ABR0DN13_9LAMI|nr:hypothetical protein RD792_001293 [Penstemon davidsonii]
MGNDVAEVVEGLPSARTIKVHARMCSELLKVVIKVSKVFPEIEAARPRCSSGIDSLCLLNNGIVKAKSLLQHCSESSVLYLALTGDAILSRCKKSSNLLHQSLNQIQNMVPVTLAAKISGIIVDLRCVAFCLDPLEEEAGRILRELLHRYDSTINSEEETVLSAIQLASSRLRITSQKSLLIEKRSIRKLLDKFGDGQQNKRKILLYFLNLLNKYGKIITKDKKDTENVDTVHFASPYQLSGEVELRTNYMCDEAEINMLSRFVPPEEFICPLSSRLMHDPVVIASGQTYERAFIQKWFDEGNDTCPKTKVKLIHLSITSNTGMKDLILKWCSTHGVSIPDSRIQESLFKSLETSTNSIASLSSSMNDLNLPLDFSNVSLGSSKGLYPDDSHTKCELDLEFLSKYSSLPWDSRCNAVEDMKRLLEQKDELWSMMPSGKLVQLLIIFLKDACEIHDVEAQMTGCVILLEFVQKHRNSTSYMKEDAYDLLASFLDTEVAKQALSILEVLSIQQQCVYALKASGALNGIFHILENQVQELLEPALRILSNSSSNGDICSSIVPSNLIPILIPLFEDSTLAIHCITILKNLCDNGNAREFVAETEDCVPSIAKLLENESHENQELAVCVLLSLCSQRVQYCQLAMDEGVIPGLVNICVNGNKKAKPMALELLRILKDEFSTTGESSGSDVVTDSCTKQHNDKNTPKTQGLFGRIFSKPSKKK